MEFKNIKLHVEYLEKCFDNVCNIGKYRNEIAEVVRSKKDIVNQISEHMAISSLKENANGYSLDYEPAIEPIINMYDKYIQGFTWVGDYYGSFIQNLMDDLTASVLELDINKPDEKRNVNITYRISSASKVAENCIKIKNAACDVSTAMDNILAIAVMGCVLEKGQRTRTPAKIQKYYADNHKTAELCDSNTEIGAGFKELAICLKNLETFWNCLPSSLSAFEQMQGEFDFQTVLTLLNDLYGKLVSMVDVKKGTDILSVTLKKADGLVGELTKLIQEELAKRTKPISVAFERIKATVPSLQSDDIYSVKLLQGSLKSTCLSPEERSNLLQHEALATLTISTICAVCDSKDEKEVKDFKGQFDLSKLQNKHVVSSDATKLLIVDDGYTNVQLAKGVYIDANDFGKDDVYFSESALSKLKKILADSSSKLKVTK